MNEGEKKVVSKMIAIYCHSRHGTRDGLCEECDALRAYAVRRLEQCPFGEDKPTCGTCQVHCYKNDMRLKIKEVMRMAGPRMFFLHPLDTITHFYRERRRTRNFASRIKS
ncbi:MAG: nitrous oxide-stimulated promoter family protein [Bacteroidales bacterium]|nr:nitrous oxide-stimulated promoter family protein [Bacteroidales bacterium]